ncbi:glycoprotein endo-alpha-1,2-mannosidase-like protein [Actinia tenebrosa]|uniref:Glycoprotein endo-alpha-1,2-mannosidase-like protein n=1 Tax=Actinia tenebrosa TaxID=6105 RepID=A0A6P8INW2_ACTTE|nr:glycoprotein endo-alpha-1,2-mannosidase-like protein [Actinia tenebrosa]
MAFNLGRRRRKFIYLAAAAVFLFGCVFIMRRISSSEVEDEEEVRKSKITRDWERYLDPKEYLKDLMKRNRTLNSTFFDFIEQEEKKEARLRKAGKAVVTEEKATTGDVNLELLAQPPNYSVHIFYYMWYGDPSKNGNYVHWNHKYLPHWDPLIAKKYAKGTHVPPEDIGANYYPALGPYSSKDPKVIHNHMKQLCRAGIGVLAVSWYPPGKADDQGGPPDTLIPLLLEIALMYNLKVTLHIEPYKGRNDKTLHEDVKYIVKTYAEHKAFYKHKHKDGRMLPLLYIYDSYLTPDADWAKLLKPQGSHSIRNTEYDCIFIGLIVKATHKDTILIGGFDGLYTYFATDGFTYGSTWRIWPQLSAYATQTGTLFIPSAGPGYIDTRVRPWNSQNTRSRQGGEYYKKSWNAAISVKPEIISITSFNEWHEGTQIEEAIPKQVSGITYNDYTPEGPDYYIKLTKEFVKKYQESQNK